MSNSIDKPEASADSEPVSGRSAPTCSIKYFAKATEYTIIPTGGCILSEGATRVTLDDLGAGEFIRIRQDDGTLNDNQTAGEISIAPDEWPALVACVEAILPAAAEKRRDEYRTSLDWVKS